MQLGLSYSDNSNNSQISGRLNDFEFSYPIKSYDDLTQFRSVFIRKLFLKSKFKFGIHLFDHTSKYTNYLFEENQGQN